MMGVLIFAAYALVAGLWIGHRLGKKEAKQELSNAIASERILRTAATEVDKSIGYVGKSPEWQVRYKANIRVDGKHYRMVVERAED